MTFYVTHRLNGALQITRIIHGVKDPEDINTVGFRPLDKFIDNVIGVVAVAQQVLTT